MGKRLSLMKIPFAARLSRAMRTASERARNFAARHALLRFEPLRQLRNSDRWDVTTISRYQLIQLNNLLHHARTDTPGYAEKFAAAGVPARLPGLAALADVPFFTKDELRSTPDRFASTSLSVARRDTITSGGTTGTPTRFTVDRAVYQPLFTAHLHAMWHRAGYPPGARCLDLSASLATPPGELREFGDGRHYLSIAQLDPLTRKHWIPVVQRLNPEFIIGFPSTVSAFARLIENEGKLPALRGVLLASEVLLPGQREELARRLGVRVFTWYGMSELAGFASGCEHADTYHFLPSAGIVEIVGDDGTVRNIPGDEGEIVLTGFLNRATPFIRYRTGDRGVIGEPCPHCRRAHAILASIDGRSQDCLLSGNGRRVPLSALNFHSDEFRRVLVHQFVQDAAGLVTLRLVALDGFGDTDRIAITALVSGRLGPGFILTLELVSLIERTPRGKIPVIVRRDSPAPPATPSLA